MKYEHMSFAELQRCDTDNVEAMAELGRRVIDEDVASMIPKEEADELQEDYDEQYGALTRLQERVASATAKMEDAIRELEESCL